MRTSHFVVLSAAIAISTSSAFAAPCESVESAGASTAYQKASAMLSERAVADRLEAIGLNSQQAHARLAQLSEQQLAQLAAQANMIQAGGTIESGHVNDLGPIGCVIQQIGVFFTNVYRLLFTWRQPRFSYAS